MHFPSSSPFLLLCKRRLSISLLKILTSALNTRGVVRLYSSLISFVSLHPPHAVVQQFYESEVNNEYVIRGNSAVLKCSIPSFVADFVQVVSWQDEEGQLYGTLDEQQGTGI